MKYYSLFTSASLLLLIASSISCANRRPGQIKTSDSIAAVEIRDSNETDIRYAIIETFLTNGYERDSAFGLTFEKKGDIVRQIEYASYMGGAARTRVQVRIEMLSARSHLVKVSAYTVTHKGSSFGDQKKSVGGFRKGNYRDLLDEVRSRVATSY